MRIAVVVVRVLLGLTFLIFGLNYFLKFLDQPPLPQGPAMSFLSSLASSGYLHVVKILEIIGGLLLLSGFFVPLGLVLLTPVIVNIALFDFCLVGKPGLGIPLLVMAGFLIWAHRAYFATVFTAKAQANSQCCG